MSKRRSPYPPKVRQLSIELVRSGRSPEELGREFEPSAQAIRNWVAQADRDEGRRRDGLTSAEREELGRLRRENRRLRQEREILAKVAAWLGLVPKQHSSGGKERMGGISKMGDRYMRHLLVVGATAIVRYTRRKSTTVSIWANRLLERKPARLVAVAVANKMARIAWAVMTREENYRPMPAAA